MGPRCAVVLATVSPCRGIRYTSALHLDILPVEQPPKQKEPMKEKTASRASKPRPKRRPKAPTGAAGRKSSAPKKTETSAKDSGREQIEQAAYFIYEHRMVHGIAGDEVSDWLAAEAEVLSEAGIALSA